MDLLHINFKVNSLFWMLNNILAFGWNRVGWEIQPSRNFFYKKQTGKSTASLVKFSSTFLRLSCSFSPAAVFDTEPLDMELFLFLLAQNAGTQCLPFKASRAHHSWRLEMQVFSWAARPWLGPGGAGGFHSMWSVPLCPQKQRSSLLKPGPPGASISKSLGVTD